MKFFKTLMNLGKIKDYAKKVLMVVIKSANVLAFLEKELDNTGILTDSIKEILPKLKAALETVTNALTKVLEFFGEDVAEEEIVGLASTGNELDELDAAINSLKDL